MRKRLCAIYAMFLVVISIALIADAAGSHGKLATTWGQIKGEGCRVRAAPRGGPDAPSGDLDVLAKMYEINEQLAAQGLNIAVEAIEFFTIGKGRPSNRIHQQPFRWVAGDFRRIAQGDDITFIVSGAPASSVGNPATGNAIRRAMATWDTEKALKKVNIVERYDPGGDITVFDFYLGVGGFGNRFAADIVSAGFFPSGPPFFSPSTLAFSVTFIFVDAITNIPTDINGDNYLDTALNEIYYNDGFDWGINVGLPKIDVETVALHELGHSLGIGHFGPPPNAVMPPVYAGIQRAPFPADHAGMAAVWASWPK